MIACVCVSLTENLVKKIVFIRSSVFNRYGIKCVTDFYSTLGIFDDDHYDGGHFLRLS